MSLHESQHRPDRKVPDQSGSDKSNPHEPGAFFRGARVSKVEQGFDTSTQNDGQRQKERESRGILSVESPQSSRRNRESGPRETGHQTRGRLRQANPEAVAYIKVIEGPFTPSATLGKVFGQKKISARYEHGYPDDAHAPHLFKLPQQEESGKDAG
jgi:hypothetical protein